MDMFDRGDFDQGFSNINVFLTLNCEDDEFQTEPDCTLLAVQTKSESRWQSSYLRYVGFPKN